MKPDSISQLDLIQARISEVPAGWQLCKVDEALNIRNNFRKPISQEVRETIKGQYPYYGPTKIQGYISEYEQDGTYALIGEDGDHFLKFGAMAQTQFISGKCTVNNHAHILESSTFCDSEWFFNYFKHRDITNFLSRQGAGRFKLNKATLEKLPMLVPPLPEQRKIARILSTWDKAISTTEKLIETSKQQKKALMQQLLKGKKRLANPETGKAFEGKWEEAKLGDILTKISNGLTYDSKATHGLPVSRIETISTGKVNHAKVGYAPNDEKTMKFKLELGDILYSHINSLEHIGRVAYFLDDKDLYHGMNLLLLRSPRSADSKFIYFMLSSSLGKAFASSHAKSAVNQASISTTDLKGFKVKLPSLGEQQKVASVLTATDKEIEVLQAKLTHFKQEKKALMQQLLTGKRRVKIDEVEAA
ncbi:restriction endonuclease subunit S [Vibrio splendidus]